METMGWAAGVPVIRRERRRQGKGELMKKATTKMVTMTMEEVKRRKNPRAEAERLKRLAAMPDEQIDTSDIPELTEAKLVPVRRRNA
jgi:hypothetical protein